MSSHSPARNRGAKKRKTVFESISVRAATKEKFRAVAERKRMDLSEVADVGADALAILTREQLDALIEKRAELATV